MNKIRNRKTIIMLQYVLSYNAFILNTEIRLGTFETFCIYIETMQYVLFVHDIN